MNNYEKITIEGNNLDGIDIIVETSKQENIVSLLNNNMLLDWNFLNHLSEFDRIEEVVSYFLKNNSIDMIISDCDGGFFVLSTDGLCLNIKYKKIIKSVDEHFSEYFDDYIMKKIYLKYERDCLQFLKNNRNKKYYYYIEKQDQSYASYTLSTADKKFKNKYLEDISNMQEFDEVVLIDDFIIDKLNLFEERLKQEQEKAIFEVLEIANEKKVFFRVICNDCVFIFRPFYLFRLEKIVSIIEKHNQSIEKGKRLLMELEKGEKELW